MRHTCFAVLLNLGFLFAPVVATAQDGFVGVFADSMGTTPCATVSPWSGVTLYVLAKTSGATSVGISGAEFRVEITNPTGWLVSFVAAQSVVAALGNPVDTDSDPDGGGGTILTFSNCQATSAGIVRLGTLSVFNMNGSPTLFLVKRHSQPPNPLNRCPLFVLCDEPAHSKVCMQAATSEPCSMSPGKVASLIGDEAVFSMALAGSEESAPLPLPEISPAALAEREAAIQAGFKETELSWRTFQEEKAWQRSMPPWMRKVSTTILNRMQLLQFKDVLAPARRSMAASFSDDRVPIDEMARLFVECKVTNAAVIDPIFFESIGGTLVGRAPAASAEYLTAWLPPEQIQTVAERSDVLSISHGSPGATHTGTVK